MELTPEECFERAMKLIDRGKTNTAIRLLQIATLRAPGDERYLKALQDARTFRKSQDREPTTEGSPAATPAPASESVPPDDAAVAPAAPTSLAEASPEAIYAQAMVFQAEGKLKIAAQMLQVAIAKSPSNGLYREALRSIRRPPQQASTVKTALDEQIQRAKQMSSYDEVERLLRGSLRSDREQPERLLMLSLLLFRIRDDAKGALGPIRESVRLAPKRLSALILQEDILRALGERTEAAKTAQAVRELSTGEKHLAKARKRLDEIIPSRHKSAAPTMSGAVTGGLTGKDRQNALLGLLGIILVLMGILFVLRQPNDIDISPYSEQLPVLSAVSAGDRVLTIQIDETEWAPMGEDERSSRLTGAMAIASTEGFQVLLVHSSSNQFLGSVRGGRPFMP
jgi:tetratricopeptide (TPR) repeat protein